MHGRAPDLTDSPLLCGCAAVCRISGKQRNLMRAIGNTMRRQTKNSDDVPEANATPALSLTCRSGDMQAIVLQAGRVDSLNYCADYEGYRLKARASPTDNALYAADLVVERRGFPSR